MTRDNTIKQKVEDLYDEHPYGFRKVLSKTNAIEKLKGKRVLEAGCGAGSHVIDRVLFGADVVAVDQSQASVIFLQQQLHKLGLKADVKFGDLECLELEPNQFDLIFSTGVLHHTPDPIAVLKNFARWLKPEGKIRLVFYHKYSCEYLERAFISLLIKYFPPLRKVASNGFKEKWEWWDKYEHPLWKVYSKNDVRRLCEIAGLNLTALNAEGNVLGCLMEKLFPPVITSYLNRVFSKTNGWHIVAECKIQTQS